MGGGKGGERNGKEGEEKERRGGKKMLATGMGRIVQFFFFLREASRLVLYASLKLYIGFTPHESIKRQNRGLALQENKMPSAFISMPFFVSSKKTIQQSLW